MLLLLRSRIVGFHRWRRAAPANVRSPGSSSGGGGRSGRRTAIIMSRDLLLVPVVVPPTDLLVVIRRTRPQRLQQQQRCFRSCLATVVGSSSSSSSAGVATGAWRRRQHKKRCARLLSTHLCRSQDKDLPQRLSGTPLPPRRRYSSSKPEIGDAPPSTRSPPSFLLLRSIMGWYTAVLDKFPLVTKMVTSGIIAASGDLLCQLQFPVELGVPTAADDPVDDSMMEIRDNNNASSAEELSDPSSSSSSSSSSSWSSSRPAWDAHRTGRFGVLGTFLVAPTVHYWYNFLHHCTSTLRSFTPVRLLAVRVTIDQLLFAPAFTTAWLVSLWTLQGQPVNDAKLLDDVPTIVVANWVLWIPAQCVNFAVVPLKLQVLFSNVVALVWNVYLSYRTSRTQRQGQHGGRLESDDSEGTASSAS